jgi:molecular chaperone DnaK
MNPIVGIDFGTTNSEVAVLDGADPRILASAAGERVIPSAVFLDPGKSPVVGAAARNVQVLHPDRTFVAIKRDLGSGRRYLVDGEAFTPEQMAGFVFSELRRIAEEDLGAPVRQAVVTVPAYFDDPRRQAVREAASQAGLQVLRLLNEPTAAALACGLRGERRGIIAVYDLGGGTFDVSILRAGGGVFEVLATRGDTRLGGDDFDLGLAKLLLERFREETGVDLSGDRLALQKVRLEAERIKILLSDSTAASAEIPFLAATARGPCHLEATLTRAELEELVAPLLERTLRLTRGALQDAGVGPAEVDHLLLVGGSSRMPAVRRAVESLIGRPAAPAVSPEEVVACGAAVEAGVLAGRTRGVALVDVTPLGLGIETRGGRMATVVERNTVLPARADAVFTTVADNQARAAIRVLQGERPLAADNIRLGEFCLEGLSGGPRGTPDIRVCFEIDVDGIVAVSARDAGTGAERAIRLSGVNSMDPEKARSIVEEARASELQDILSAGVDP